jgi:hypothetical protein
MHVTTGMIRCERAAETDRFGQVSQQILTGSGNPEGWAVTNSCRILGTLYHLQNSVSNNSSVGTFQN